MLFRSLTREIGLDERLFGAVVAIMGAGGVVAGMFSGRLVDALGRRWTIVLVAALPVATMAALAGADRPWEVVVLATLQAMLTTVWSVVAVSMRQQLVPDEYFGRVNGVYRWLSWGAMPVGAAVGGTLAQGVGLRSPYVVGAWLLAGAAVFVIARVAPFAPERSAAA